MPNVKILLAEDDAEQAEEMKDYLEEYKYNIKLASNSTEFLSLFKSDNFDLILLDLGLGGTDGIDLTHAVRKVSEVPIIMVTGRNDTIDRVVGLQVGADDYVVKPFDLRELVARISAVLRRSRTINIMESDTDSGVFIFNDVRFYSGRMALNFADGSVQDLTAAENGLLSALTSRPGRILTRDFLIDRIYGREWSINDRSIDNLVLRLRRKIGGNETVIKSIRGTGYTFVAQVRSESDASVGLKSGTGRPNWQLPREG